MSRSRKKVPMIKDGAPGFKKLANRVLRHRVKIQVNQGKEVLAHRHETINQYSICDWKNLAIPGQDPKDRIEKFKRK